MTASVIHIIEAYKMLQKLVFSGYIVKKTVDSIEAFEEGVCPYCDSKLETVVVKDTGYGTTYYLACHNCKILFKYNTREAYEIKVREEEGRRYEATFWGRCEENH